MKWRVRNLNLLEKKISKVFFCRDLSNEMQHYSWSTLCFSIQRQPSEASHSVWKSLKKSHFTTWHSVVGWLCFFRAKICSWRSWTIGSSNYKHYFWREDLKMRLFWWFSYTVFLLVEGHVFSFYQTFSFHLQGPWGQPVCKFAMPH